MDIISKGCIVLEESLELEGGKSANVSRRLLLSVAQSLDVCRNACKMIIGRFLDGQIDLQ